ncbi:MAG: hypothetical protein U0T79_06645 [Ferruginibacter sp.]
MIVPEFFYVLQAINDYLLLYSPVMLLLLIGSLVANDRYRNEAFNLIYVFNTLVAWCYLLSFLNYLSELFVAWYGQNAYEWFSFKSGGGPVNEKWFLFKMLLPLLAGMLFFFRAARTNRVLIVVFLVLLNLGLIENFIFVLSKDYLPSSWETDYREIFQWRRLTGHLIIAILLLLIYRGAARKGRLYHPSLFIK